jgi:hypothetical protein
LFPQTVIFPELTFNACPSSSLKRNCFLRKDEATSLGVVIPYFLCGELEILLF